MLLLPVPLPEFWATGAWVAALTGATVGADMTAAVGVAVAAELHAERIVNAITNMAGTEYKLLLRILSYPYPVNLY
jgi:hypothetical protein